MKTLTRQQIDELLKAEPQWRLLGGKLVREWAMDDFVQAISFVNQVADVAEAEGHHPEIDVRYNRVILSLISHDAGGLTERDAFMVATLSRAFPV